MGSLTPLISSGAGVNHKPKGDQENWKPYLQYPPTMSEMAVPLSWHPLNLRSNESETPIYSILFYLKAKGYSLGVTCPFFLCIELSLFPFGLVWLSSLLPLTLHSTVPTLVTKQTQRRDVFLGLDCSPPSLPPSRHCASWRAKAEGSRSSWIVSWPVAPPWWPSQTPPSRHPWSWPSTPSNQRRWSC